MNRPTPSGIRRNLDRRGLATFTAATLSCMLLAGAALLHAWVRTRVTEQGYQLSRLSAEYRELSRAHQALQLKAAELRSPQRIEELARTRLSMGPPPLDRVVVLVQESPGSAQRRAEAGGRSIGVEVRTAMMTAAR